MKPPTVNRITAIIVLFFPKFDLLDRLLKSAIGQVNQIIVIDNTPTPSEMDFSIFLKKYGNNVCYQALNKNFGIAFAQNIGIKKAFEGHCSHVLLLDQDSALPSDMIVNLLKAESLLLEAGVQVAALGPAFIHENTRVVEKAIKYTYLRIQWIELDLSSDVPVETDSLIASGSLIRASVLKTVGLMREDLFIDRVDTEWSLRAKYQGFKSYVLPNVLMTHSVGDTSKKFVNSWYYFHSDARHYYIIRNSVYLLRVKTMGLSWRIENVVNEIPKSCIKYLIFSDHKWITFKLILRALRDGCLGKLGRID